MRAGWEVKPLGELCDFQRGLTYAKSDEVPVSNNIVLRANNVDLLKNELDLSDLRFISKAVQVPPDKKLRKGSLLICTASGSKSHLGKVAYVEDDYGYAFGGFMGQITPAPGVDGRYLFHALTSPSYKDFIAALSDGANINNLKFADLRQFSIAVPPIEEQRRIVAILDEAFVGIATAKANTEKNLQNARAIFESYLQSVFTQRGDGWKDKTLEQISTTFGRGKSRHRPRNDPTLYGGEYPFIQTGDIRNAGHFITAYSQTYSELGLAQSRLWPKGTICITIAANIAETGILEFDACFPDSVIGVVPNPAEAEVGFVEYLLQSFKVRIQALGQGSAQANINMGTFENELFPFPGVDEQRLIIAKLDDLNEETRHLETTYRSKLVALDTLKKSLLHQAFSGLQ